MWGTISRSNYSRRIAAILAACCAYCSVLMGPYALAGNDAPFQAGAGKYEFPLHANDSEGMSVWYYLPAHFSKDDRVLFVMHGVNRNADEYRDNWIELAERYRLLVIAPEFSERLFPTESSYQLGNVFDKNGSQQPRERWSYALIERIFDDVVARNHLTAERFSIFGHSAGGQFVHRLMLLCPSPRIDLAIAANAGWYTMPTLNQAFPYGLKGAPIDEQRLASALSNPLVILIGEEDTDPHHQHLRRTPEALAQGPHRFARGQSFYQRAQRYAHEASFPFRWRLVTVPGVDHDNAKMAVAAAKLLEH